MRTFAAFIGCAILIAAAIVSLGLHVRHAPGAPVPHPAPAKSTTPQSSPPPPPEVTYSVAPFRGTLDTLRQQFTPEQLGLLEKLNRAELNRLPRLKELVVPSRWDLDELAYSPLPETYRGAEGTPKLIVVDIPGQAFGAYENGRLIRWGPVSSGGPDAPTPDGVYHVTWKAKLHYSTEDPDWRLPWVLNFGLHRGLDLHAYDLPGRPASHACVRLLDRDAEWLYGWADQWRLGRKGKVDEPGTPIFVVGGYDYGAPPPWRSPEWLARGIELPEFPGVEAEQTAENRR